jgi:hypothetical protein
MVETQRWVTSSLVRGSYVQLFWNLVDSLWGLFPAAIVGVIISMTLLDKKVRQRNLNEHQTSKEPNEAVTQHSLTTPAETRNQG